MTFCLTFAVHNRPTPLHFCYGSEEEARTNLEEFSRSIYVANEDELVLINNSAGFLKRSFVSVELDGYSSDDGDDEPNAAPDVPTPTQRKKRKRATRRSKSPKSTKRLEADLEKIVSSLTQNSM